MPKWRSFLLRTAGEWNYEVQPLIRAPHLHPSKAGESESIMDNKVLPVKKFRVGSVTAAVWKNDGNFSVTLQKSYKVKDTEEWKNTDFLFHSDILCALKALERAEDFIAR